MSKITDQLTAYEIIEDRTIEDLNSAGYLLRHKKTGARIMVLANDDENKVFYIGFRTPPADSTGVAHILEHSVLCGSKNFPIKDPFIELAKGSLNTFLNAMTYPDKTLYPVASCNDKDFANLMHVYLDAVFYPNIYQEEKIFMQEGWHYEMEHPEDELTINGVVYNEMKGAFSSPDDVLEREIMNSLYPDTAYGMESGGDPDAIPTLTYEQFLDFHRRYYHPSNSYIYLYGNMDMEERLRFLDEEYLSHFDKITVPSEISMQSSFDSVREIQKEYSVLEGENTADSTYLAYSISTGTSLDPQLYIALQVLEYVLCAAPGAPIKQALLDQGIGRDVYSILENGILQPYFSVVAKDTEAEKKEAFAATIEKVLRSVAETGIDKKALAAGINYYEFRYREADFGSYPKGLMLGLQAMDSWLYDESKPFMHIEANHTYEVLRGKINSSYYEDLLKQYLIDNLHKSIITVSPHPGLTTKREAKLKAELQEYKKVLSAGEISAMIEKTEELSKYQETPNAIEALQTIPLLTREDMKKEAADFVNEERTAGDTTVLFHPVFSNGIGYIRFVFDIKKIPAELFPYIGILKSALTMIGTKNYSYHDLYNEINIHTGGIKSVVNTYTQAANLEEYKVTFEIKVKALFANRAKAFELVREIMLATDFSDTKRLYEIISEAKSRMQAGMTSSGHSVAAVRAMSYFSKTAQLSGLISGIPQYRLLEELEANFEQKKDDVVEKLNLLKTYIFRAENLMVDYTATADGYDGLEDQIIALKKDLFTQPVDDGRFTPELGRKNEGFMTAAQIQYVCRAGNFTAKGLPYTGALKVLKVMMGYEYLWNQVRVKGGAYGCMSNFTRSGDCYFVSYRDPNLEKTVEVYENAADYIRNYQADERTVTQFIIGAISDLDIPMTPSTKGAYSLSAYMTGLTYEMLQQERDELLGVTGETLRGLAGYVEAFMQDECLCVVGNEDKIKENSNMFGQIEQLFH